MWVYTSSPHKKISGQHLDIQNHLGLEISSFTFTMIYKDIKELLIKIINSMEKWICKYA